MVNAENPVLEMIPIVSEATAVPAGIIPIVVPEITPIAEAVSNVVIPVESVVNVSKSSDVIIDPPQIGDE